MQRYVVMGTVLTGIFALTLTLLPNAGATLASAADKSAHSHTGQSGFAPEMHTGMMRMMQDMDAAPMTGNADVDFMAMMIPHHEGAVEMARLVLIHGNDPLVRKLAEEIIASQQVEISAMRERLTILRKGADVTPGGFPALGGERGHVTGEASRLREARYLSPDPSPLGGEGSR